MNWQPIETAPKDGTLILVVCTKGITAKIGHMAVDRWTNEYTGGFGKFNAQWWPATHWMPLPDPPAP